MVHRGRLGALLKVEEEINAERGSALAHAGALLERHLLALAGLRERLQHASGQERDALLKAYASQRAEAETRRWYLMVQREALGLRNHDALDIDYPVPPKIER